MAESRLKFYIGDITDGGTDGVSCTSVQCLFPLVYLPNAIVSNGYPGQWVRAPIKFALRCDEGYQAANVKLTFEKGNLFMGYVKNDYSVYCTGTNNISSLDIGTVNNTNRIVKLYSGFYPDNAIKIYASYTEVKL